MLKDFFTLVLLFIICIFLGCNQPGRVSIVHKRPLPRLLGVNHLFTIKRDFSKLTGIAIDMEGNLYVADRGRSIIHVLDKDGNKFESIGRFGWKNGEFDNPIDICLDSQLRLYVADTGNNRIQRFSLLNRDFSIIIGEAQDKSKGTIKLLNPQGVFTDIRGYIYVADTYNHRIVKVDPLGRLIMEIGGIGLLNKPQGIAVDIDNSIYVCDTGNNRLIKFNSSGMQIAEWSFNNPVSVSLDKFGYIYVVDQGSHSVKVFDKNGNPLIEFGDQYLNEPFDIAIDKELRVYITDILERDIEVFRIITDIEKP